MGGASKVMYSIANFFTWILVLASIAGIVVFSLVLTGLIPNNTGESPAYLIGGIVYLSIVAFFSLITISMVRRAKKSGTSKGWDLLFIILGVLSGNIFYVLGGIFGLIAIN